MTSPARRPPGGRRPTTQSRLGTLFVLAAAVIWGSLGVIGRVAFRAGLTPLEASFFRAGIAFLALFAWMLARRSPLRIRAGDVPLFAAYGLVGIAVFFFAYLYAINQTSVATAAILLYTAPAFVILISAVALKERITQTKVVALFFAFVGCLLVVGGYRPESVRLTLPGVAAGLVSGFTYAMYSIFGKRALRRYSTPTILVYALGFGALFLGTAGLATGAITWSHSIVAWGTVVYLGLVTTLLAQGLYLSGLRFLEAGRASLIATVEPLVAAGFGYVVLGERLDIWQALGGVLIIAAVIAAVIAVQQWPSPADAG